MKNSDFSKIELEDFSLSILICISIDCLFLTKDCLK